jgi:hypothetical protein
LNRSAGRYDRSGFLGSNSSANFFDATAAA